MGDIIHKRLGILGSGKGSNFKAIFRAIESGEIPAEAVLVVSDVPDAGILALADKFGVPAKYIPPGNYRARLSDEAEKDYIDAFKEAGADWVILAGFMRVLKSSFLQAFPEKIVNIHPSLLPSFPGLRAWEQALDYRVKFTGCTVHLVDRGVDTGTILGQEPVPVLDDDNADTLHQRIQESEWGLYPKILSALMNDKIQIVGRNAVWKKD